MAHDPTTHTKVRTAYVAGQTLEEAAAGARVAEGTARRWRGEALAKGDDWDRARSASLMSGQGRESAVREILEAFLLAHQTAIQQVRDDTAMTAMERTDALAKLADAINKTMSALVKAEPKLSRIGVAQELLTQLADFVTQRFPTHQRAMLEILTAFGPEFLSRE